MLIFLLNVVIFYITFQWPLNWHIQHANINFDVHGCTHLMRWNEVERPFLSYFFNHCLTRISMISFCMRGKPISSGIISSYTFLFSQTPICTIPADWSDFDPDVRLWLNTSIDQYIFFFIITHDNYYNYESALCDYSYKL